MSTREALFWGRITEGLWHPRRVLNRIENGVVDGMPDSVIVDEGITNWLELKAPIEPARFTTPLFGNSNHRLSQAQLNWLLAHRQAGGRGWVAIETTSWVFLIGARNADKVNAQPFGHMSALAAYTAARPLSPLHWQEFRATLLSKELP